MLGTRMGISYPHYSLVLFFISFSFIGILFEREYSSTEEREKYELVLFPKATDLRNNPDSARDHASTMCLM